MVLNETITAVIHDRFGLCSVNLSFNPNETTLGVEYIPYSITRIKTELH